MDASKKIDELIAGIADWRGKTLAAVRKAVLARIFTHGRNDDAVAQCCTTYFELIEQMHRYAPLSEVKPLNGCVFA